MRYEVSTRINAPLERVWAVLTDVEAMPEWTASMTRVQRLDEGPLAVGSTVRMKQPKLPVAVWHVVELDPVRFFAWRTRSGGITTRAEHVLTPEAGDGVTATFTLRQSGLPAPLVGLFTAAMVRRYVDTELNGLRARCEGTSPLTGAANRR